VLTWGVDGTARIWDPSNGHSLALLQPRGGPIYAASWSPDGSRVATGTSRGTVQVWDGATGRRMTVMAGRAGTVGFVAWSPDGSELVTGGEDHTPVVWNASTGTQITLLVGHSKPVLAGAWTPDGRRIVTASDDRTARVWDPATGRTLHVLSDGTGDLSSVAIQPNGRLVLVGGPSTCALYSVESGRFMGSCSAASVKAASWSPDGTRVAIATQGGAVEVYATEQSSLHPGGEFLHLAVTLDGHVGPVRAVGWDPTGSTVVSAGEDHTARVWNARSGSPILVNPVAVLRGPRHPLGDADWNPQGTEVATGGVDARVWDLGTSRPVFVHPGYPQGVFAVFGWRGRTLVTLPAGGSGAPELWDVASGGLVRTLGGLSGSPSAISYPTDRRYVAVTTEDGEAVVWDTRSGRTVAILQEPGARLAAADINPDDSEIATASEDGTARVWSLPSGRVLHVLRGHNGPVESVAWSPDGREVVTGGVDGTVRVWNARTGRETSTLTDPGAAVSDVAFSPDGHEVAGIDIGGNTWVWDIRTGLPRRFSGTTNVDVFSNDGRLLASGSPLGARVFDVATGAVIANLALPRTAGGRTGAHTIFFAPGGRRIVTADTDGTAAVFACRLCVPTRALLSIAERRQARALTPDECRVFLPNLVCPSSPVRAAGS
jgi:WD40 repeat protein